MGIRKKQVGVALVTGIVAVLVYANMADMLGGAPSEGTVKELVREHLAYGAPHELTGFFFGEAKNVKVSSVQVIRRGKTQPMGAGKEAYTFVLRVKGTYDRVSLGISRGIRPLDDKPVGLWLHKRNDGKWVLEWTNQLPD